ncbi:MAG: c-type cytochrome [Clostridia bacterium]
MLKRSFVAAALLAASTAPALAQHHDQHAGSGEVERLHAQCIGCHGIPGYKTAFPVVYHVPKIAGQQKGYIEAALKEYRSGARSHPSMRGIAASLTDADIDKLASYYSGMAAK